MVKISVQDLRVYFNDPGVEKSAKTLIKAVDGMSVEFNEGERVAIIGKNGAGKTTTINILLGLIAPTSGDAFIDNKSIVTNKSAIACT